MNIAVEAEVIGYGSMKVLILKEDVEKIVGIAVEVSSSKSQCWMEDVCRV